MGTNTLLVPGDKVKSLGGSILRRLYVASVVSYVMFSLFPVDNVVPNKLNGAEAPDALVLMLVQEDSEEALDIYAST